MSKLEVKNRYGVTPNTVLNHPRLTFKAKGLFGFIQSKPEDWDFSAERIARQSGDGVDSVKAGLQELEREGFLTRSKFKNEKGHWEWSYTLAENPSVDFPPVDFPSVENTPNISKKEIVSKTSKKEVAPPSKKSHYGELKNVLLTDEEKGKLIERYGRSVAQHYVEKLSLYLASRGRAYKSHYAVIRSWALRDKAAVIQKQPAPILPATEVVTDEQKAKIRASKESIAKILKGGHN